MRAPSEDDLVALLTLERPPEPPPVQPHAYEPISDQPGWCRYCPQPREHRVHLEAAGERP